MRVYHNREAFDREQDTEIEEDINLKLDLKKLMVQLKSDPVVRMCAYAWIACALIALYIVFS